MRFVQLLVFLRLIVRVWASNAAGPYEAIAFFYAYKMEYEAAENARNPEEERYLGYKCSNFYGKMCNFSQFLKYVYKNNLGGYGLDVRNNGPFNPDDETIYPLGPGDKDTMNRMASDLAADGFRGASFAPDELYWDAQPYANYKFIIRNVMNRVQFARQQGVTTYVDGIKNAFQGIHGERIADEMINIIDDLVTAVHADTGYDLVTRQATSPGGREYTDIDWFETSNRIYNSGAPPSALGDEVQKVVDSVTNFQNANGNHYEIIRVVGSQVDRVSGSDTC